jgi:hypothetical protein
MFQSDLPRAEGALDLLMYCDALLQYLGSVMSCIYVVAVLSICATDLQCIIAAAATLVAC